ncbi:unnamed protein product [Protopolystoma xenopodis]|uniref:Uncharacterized protein n=1 Tax=Protopolystoma xenopodis TaxID=117903 RepID=A0A448X4F5_9PLAT|nr:unnamed protein product [Protopolystoma xenopodis]
MVWDRYFGQSARSEASGGRHLQTFIAASDWSAVVDCCMRGVTMFPLQSPHTYTHMHAHRCTQLLVEWEKRKEVLYDTESRMLEKRTKDSL